MSAARQEFRGSEARVARNRWNLVALFAGGLPPVCVSVVLRALHGSPPGNMTMVLLGVAVTVVVASATVVGTTLSVLRSVRRLRVYVDGQHLSTTTTEGQREIPWEQIGGGAAYESQTGEVLRLELRHRFGEMLTLRNLENMDALVQAIRERLPEGAELTSQHERGLVLSPRRLFLVGLAAGLIAAFLPWLTQTQAGAS